jgi:hypothetical protein
MIQIGSFAESCTLCGPSRWLSALTCTVSQVPPKKSRIGTNWSRWTV